jgi:hypothetical protein
MAGLTLPSKGLPPVLDWIVVFKNMLIHGPRLGREPIDVSVPAALRDKKGDALIQGLGIVKGWTRATCAMTILLAASEQDAASDVSAPLLYKLPAKCVLFQPKICSV